MRTISKKRIALMATGVLALGLLIPAGSAQADPAPSSGDIVGVGSDTLQYMLDFGADGDNGGDGGYNAGHVNRLASIDATPDANARAGYLNGSTNGALLNLNPTVVLRAGQSPVTRPNGSGDGFNALAADSTDQINFTRSSSVMSSTQLSAFTQSGGIGDVHVIRLAHERLQLVTAKTTNAPTLTTAQLFAIYECTDKTWTQVGGTSTDNIIPVVPQLGSGTRKTFLQDLGFSVDSAGNPTPALGACVRTDEENNPYALYVTGDSPTGDVANGGAVTPDADPYATNAIVSPDAIEPFSGARLNLYNEGYFSNPNVKLGAPLPSGDESTLSPQIKVNTGTGAYNDERGLYVIFRQSDVTSSAHFNGLAKNWVQTLFLNPSGTAPFFDSPTGELDLLNSGVDPDYADCGVNAITASACGAFGPDSSH